MIKLESLVRKNIKNLKPYSSARDDFHGDAEIFLDANENSFGSPLAKQWNRYPDPHQRVLKERLGQIKKISSDRIFLGNGSDEAIDLLIRAFCEPLQDQIMILPPTYGMYQVCAAINNVEVKQIPLKKTFGIDVDAVINELNKTIRLLFICSPNNPTANLMNISAIEIILQRSKSLVVIDEAYIDFASQDSLVSLLDRYSNLVILQTFSKAWGLASIRLGMAFADPFIINILNNIKPPYNVNGVTQKMALEALQNFKRKTEMVSSILEQRKYLENDLKRLKLVDKVFSSDANFLLVRFKDSHLVFKKLMDTGIIVRDRSTNIHCENCLRITVGTEEENKRLVDTLKKMEAL